MWWWRDKKVNFEQQTTTAVTVASHSPLHFHFNDNVMILEIWLLFDSRSSSSVVASSVITSTSTATMTSNCLWFFLPDNGWTVQLSFSTFPLLFTLTQFSRLLSNDACYSDDWWLVTTAKSLSIRLCDHHYCYNRRHRCRVSRVRKEIIVAINDNFYTSDSVSLPFNLLNAAKTFASLWFDERWRRLRVVLELFVDGAMLRWWWRHDDGMVRYVRMKWVNLVIFDDLKASQSRQFACQVDGRQERKYLQDITKIYKTSHEC